jgi:hypothetical protein
MPSGADISDSMEGFAVFGDENDDFCKRYIASSNGYPKSATLYIRKRNV